MTDIFCNELAICNEIDDGMDDAFAGVYLLYESISPIKRSKSNPRTARNAHMVPGGLNGGGKELVTFCSRPVATKTEATDMVDARITAVKVGQLEVLVVGSTLVDWYSSIAFSE